MKLLASAALRGHIFLAIGLLVASCSSMSTLNLHSMPRYDVAGANQEWRKIEELNQSWAKYQQVIGLMEQNGLVFGKPERDAINAQLDVFLYHKAAATIYLFQGDYPAMTLSIADASSALDGVEALIIAAIEGQRV